MLRVGRVLTVLAILGFALVWSTSLPPIQSALNQSGTLRSAFGAIGAITAFSMFGAWGLAIYHWGLGTAVVQAPRVGGGSR